MSFVPLSLRCAANACAHLLTGNARNVSFNVSASACSRSSSMRRAVAFACRFVPASVTCSRVVSSASASPKRAISSATCWLRMMSTSRVRLVTLSINVLSLQNHGSFRQKRKIQHRRKGRKSGAGRINQATFTFSAQPGARTEKLTLLRSTLFAAIAILALMPMRTAYTFTMSPATKVLSVCLP